MRYLSHYLIYFFIACLVSVAKAQIVINEVSVGNSTVLQDEDGDFPDWIELYNNSASSVDLMNYGISDETSNLYKWIFPSTSIAANSYLTIMASGKDRGLSFDHLETVIYPDSSFRYMVPAVEPDSNWRILPGFNDSGWSLGQAGIGYGDGDDVSVLIPPVTSVFIRRVFNIIDASVIPVAVLHLDYDDAFVAYLNGVEIGRGNIGQNGTPTPFDSTARDEHEAAMYAGGLPDPFIFDGALFNTGTNVLAIQVHNTSIFSSDLSAIPFLTLAIADIAYNYDPIPVWFPFGKPRVHTNFKLSVGEVLSLTDPIGNIQDQYVIGPMQIDNSTGRFPDASNTVKLFGTPTPDSTNNSSVGADGYTNDPAFSIDAGFYTGSQNLTITSSSPSTNIYYTTNGDIPTVTSKLYTGSILIDSTKVIKARAFSSASLLPSSVMTNTYLIDENISLPVFSISTDSLNLWDWNTGIYVKGPFADSTVPFFGANFWQRIEVPTHVEYFDKNKQQGFEQVIGLKIFGNYSRSNPQKSFKFIAREDYGKARMNYKLFPDKEIYEFKQIALRDAGNDWNNTHMKDASIHTAVLKETNIDVQDYQPCILFLNGEYWGVYNIREKINEHYISNNYDIDADSIDLLEYGGSVMTGSNQNFNELLGYIFWNDMTIQSNYDSVKTWLDIDNFIDYFVVEIYINNGDWLSNNIRFWRQQKASAKWRYILWDVDFGFSTWLPFTTNGLQNVLDKSIWEVNAFMFNKLLLNMEFRNAFINRHADLANTLFSPTEYSQHILNLRDTIDTEMPRHFSKWGWPFNNPDWGIPGQGTYGDWKNNNIPNYLTTVTNRQPVARQDVQDVFLLKKQVATTLNVERY